MGTGRKLLRNGELNGSYPEAYGSGAFSREWKMEWTSKWTIKWKTWVDRGVEDLGLGSLSLGD